MSESLLPQYDPAKKYQGTLFIEDNERRFQSDAIEMAIRKDDAAQLAEIIAKGWITPDSRTLMNGTVIARCMQCGAGKCADSLRALGWPE